MSYKKSLTIGSCLLATVFLISVLVFYLSLGVCPSGSFACDKGKTCVLQRQYCDGKDHCRDRQDENITECGHFHGSKEMLNNLWMRSHGRTKIVKPKCVVDELLKFKCECLTDTLINCKNLTEFPSPLPYQVTKLELTNNSIELTNDSLKGLTLEILNLKRNNISQMPSKIFSGQTRLEKLFLSKNQIEEIPSGLFKDATSLVILFLESNKIVKIPLNEFENLKLLEWLQLSDNQLTLIGQCFPVLESIFEIHLDDNLIEMIDENLFANLKRLHLLSLNNNKIKSIHPKAFVELTNLRELRISNNLLQILPEEMFYKMTYLEALYLGYNNVSITMKLLNGLNVSYLNLDGIKYQQISFDAIKQLPSLQFIVYEKYYFCSLTPHVKNCRPITDGVSSLEDLLTKPVLRYSVWLMATLTCLGNGLVLWGRFTFRDENRTVSMVIRNLADILMGLYLSILGIQDARFRTKYHEVSQEWMGSWSCAAAGVLAMISSEVSKLILTFMSIERFLLIADPFGGHRKLNTQNVFVALFTIWLIGGALAIIPVIHWRTSTRFYGAYSGTCFPLLSQEEYPLGWQYSAFVFIGINTSLLVLIATLYTALLVSIWRTRKATPLTVFDCEFAIRFLFIVLTDATCWVPIIALKILTYCNFEISGDVFAWLVVFILPLNSAVNPLLYTFTTPKYRDQLLTSNWNKITTRRKRDGSGNSNQGGALITGSG